MVDVAFGNTWQHGMECICAILLYHSIAAALVSGVMWSHSMRYSRAHASLCSKRHAVVACCCCAAYKWSLDSTRAFQITLKHHSLSCPVHHAAANLSVGCWAQAGVCAHASVEQWLPPRRPSAGHACTCVRHTSQSGVQRSATHPPFAQRKKGMCITCNNGHER